MRIRKSKKRIVVVVWKMIEDKSKSPYPETWQQQTKYTEKPVNGESVRVLQVKEQALTKRLRCKKYLCRVLFNIKTSCMLRIPYTCFSLLGFIFFIQPLRAQLYELPFSEIAGRSTLIVEGRVIARNAFWDNQRHNIYTANTEPYPAFLKAPPWPRQRFRSLPGAASWATGWISCPNRCSTQWAMPGCFAWFPPQWTFR
jgi:hypothetical protein